MAKFAMLLRFGPDVEARLAVRPLHRAYLQGLLERGKLYASGPWADDSGALIVYEADDEAEARSLFAGDPYAAAGEAVVASSELKEWNRVFAAEG